MPKLQDFVGKITMVDNYSKSFEGLNRQTKGAGSALGALTKISGAFAAVGGVYMAKRVAGAAWEMGKLGAEALTVRDSFETMMHSAGLSNQVLQQMKLAAGGTIAELELMRQANTALVGVSGDLAGALGQAFPQLIQIARAANKANPALGDTTHLFNSLVLGIKRSSPMILDNLGLQLKLSDAYKQFADQLGVSTDALTAQQKTMALLNATLEAGDRLIEQVGGNVDSMQDSFSRAEVASERLKDELGKLFAPTTTGLADEFARLTGNVADFIDAINIDEVQEFVDQISTLQSEVGRMQRNKEIMGEFAALDLPRLQEDLRKAKQELMFFQHQLAAGPSVAWESGLVDELARLDDKFMKGEISASQYVQAVEDLIAANQRGAASTREMSDAMSDGTRQVNSYADALRNARRRGAILRNEQRRLATDLAGGIRTIAGAGMAIPPEQAARLYEEYQQRIHDIDIRYMWKRGDEAELFYQRDIQAANEWLQAQVDLYREYGARVGQFYDDLIGRIEAQLQPTFKLSDLAPGLLPEGGEARFDEHYRRLAAIALRGSEELQKHAEDWQDTIALIPEDVKAQGVNAIQQWAGDMVRAYDAGLDFSLIDKDLIKQRIMQALQAEQIKKEVVAQIYDELGGAVSLGDIQAAAGVTGGFQTQGADIAGSLVSGLETSIETTDVGTLVSTAWATDFTEAQPVFEAIGMSTGGIVVEAFVEAVAEGAGEAREKLAEAVAPEVAEILARQEPILP